MYKWIGFFILMGCGFLAKAEGTDPTKPTAYQADGAEGEMEDADGTIVEPSKKSLQLTSILISEDRKIAVIDGAFRKEGDVVGLYRIVKIREYQVDLQSDTEMKTLEIGQSILKSTKPEEKGRT